ncbi:MAG TPA: bifunctional hydroxymethylpyrimidine kinase/phosphomethylpyrimidine kinase [Acidobacteriaceae bacterium]
MKTSNSPSTDSKQAGAAAPPVLLTIAGYDPSSGAGITADLAVFAALGGYGISCITGLTVQSTAGVAGVEAVPGATVAATLACLAADLPVAGVKIGMLATGETVDVVREFCGQHPGIPTVLDPVWRSSSGRELINISGEMALRENLLGCVGWITPNLAELAMLTGVPVESAADVPATARRLKEMAAALGNHGLNVVVTGGHLDRPDDFLLTNEEALWISGTKVETRSTHGTGCAFSSALLAGLVIHPERRAAEQVRAAKAYVRGALEHAVPLGRGHGPMNLLWPLRVAR